MGLDRAPIEFQTFYFSHVLVVPPTAQKKGYFFGIPSLIVFKVQKTFVERITLQIVQTMVGVTGELMRCHLCKCMLPTSISQKQFLHHVQVAYYSDFFPKNKIIFATSKSMSPFFYTR